MYEVCVGLEDPEDSRWQYPYRNKAPVGFSEPVVGQLVPGNAAQFVGVADTYGPDRFTNPQPVGHLHHHVAKLCDELKNFGPNHKVHSAVAEANDQFPPRSLPNANLKYARVDMSYAGDGSAKLSKVYLHPAEEIALNVAVI